MSWVTVAELREHVESDRSDAALQVILDAVEADLSERFGTETLVTERRILPRGVTRAILRAVPDGLVTVVNADGDTLVLDEDYEVSGGILSRLSYDYVDTLTITYVPSDFTNARRRMAIINLAKLELAYSGYRSQSTPDASETTAEYEKERAAIIRTLSSKRRLFA